MTEATTIRRMKQYPRGTPVTWDPSGYYGQHTRGQDAVVSHDRGRARIKIICADGETRTVDRSSVRLP